MPNWNSITRPVATPMAKLMPNSVPQNRVIWRQTGLRVMTYTLSMMATRNERPSVRGTNKKWYIAVKANCSRDSSTTVESIMAWLPRWGFCRIRWREGVYGMNSVTSNFKQP